MNARFTTFGATEIDGRRYDHDVVIDGGTVRQRAKQASKAYCFTRPELTDRGA